MKLSQEEKSFFPLTSADEFLNFFKSHISQARDQDKEPNLALLSIILGYLEHHLTLTKSGDQQSSSAESDADPVVRPFIASEKKNLSSTVDCDTSLQETDESTDFPILEFDVVEALYIKFSTIIKGLVDKSLPENTTRGGYATKELCKKVSNILWNRLNPHYHKDKAHIQSLFSFLTGYELDCFGLALVVIAACQILRYSDVHLALTEDHAWAVHGDGSKEMTEITWHGKGNEDKRGLSVKETDIEKSWMYLQGNAIICDRMTEVAAMVVSMNPSIDTHTDSKVIYDIQHQLLSFLHSLGALVRYPMGLGVLAEMEDSQSLHTSAVECVKDMYNGSHVFPHCSEGIFHFHHGDSKQAIRCWAEAAQVLSRYNYTREDEEVYKEIMEIAGELVPQAIKNDPSVCEDEKCFIDIIRFYDGICLWEEDSPTPVLHSWWAKFFTQSLGRFTSEVRESFKKADPGNNSSANRKDGETVFPEGKTGSRKSKRNSTRLEESELPPSRDGSSSKLGIKSVKMIGLEELLVCGKKINAHTVSLQLTAQSQVHFVKRRSNISDYSIDYVGRVKRSKKDLE